MVFVAFILVKDREKSKDFFDRHAFSWDKDLGKENRTHKAEEVVGHYQPYSACSE